MAAFEPSEMELRYPLDTRFNFIPEIEFKAGYRPNRRTNANELQWHFHHQQAHTHTDILFVCLMVWSMHKILGPAPSAARFAGLMIIYSKDIIHPHSLAWNEHVGGLSPGILLTPSESFFPCDIDDIVWCFQVP